MDIFGTITNAIDLAGKIVSYVQAVKGIKKDCLELLSEVSVLGALLQVLRGRLNSINADSNDANSVSRLLMAGIEGPLHQSYEDLQSTVTELERIASSQTTKPSSLLEKMKTVTWPFRQEDIRAMLGKMERLKSLVLLALQTSAMEFIEETRDELENLGLDVKRIKGAVLALEEAQKAHIKETEALRINLCDLVIGVTGVKDEIATIGKIQRDQVMKEDRMRADLTIIKKSAYDQELQDLVKWLSPLDFSEKHNIVFEKCTRDTGEWFLKRPKFLAWRRGDSGCETLWCPGRPGVGKSVMTSLAINNLRKGIPENMALVFIYFEYKTKYTISQLAEVILKQLIQRHITPSSLKLLRKYKAGNRPTYEELFDVLKIELGTYNRVLIVIDALDEVDIEVWTTLLGRLRALRKISLLATSRDGTSEIGLGLQPYQRLDIVADEGDMRKYIEDRLGSSMKFKRLLEGRADIREKVVIEVIKKAAGMFLLAQLHTNSLETKLRITDLYQALDELPKTLDTTYDEAMLRIRSDHKALAYQIISWLIHAAQPMTIHDLQYALAVRDEMTALDDDDLYDEAFLISICAGLVVLQGDASGSEVANAPSGKVVGFVHYTAQEYFLRNPNVCMHFVDSAYFAITCLRYLAFDIFKTDGPLDEDTKERVLGTPFAEYAILHWGGHARMHWDNEVVRNLATELLRDNRRVVTVGSLAYHLESLLDDGCDVNLKDSDGDTVVSYAALFGQEEIMRLLLAREGIDVDPKGWNGTTPLVRAAVGGHETIVQLLLARDDLDVNQHDDSGDTPIIKAAQRGHSNIVKLLLTRDDVDVNLQGHDGCTPLSAAARRGHKAIVQLLLARNDLYVNPRDNVGNTPIIDATWNGHCDVVALLLAQDGVDVNLQGQDGYTPLSLATHRGHEAVVQLLLARNDLDANQRNDSGDTPIIIAARKGRSGIMKLLLAQSNVEINSQGRDGYTPLSAAAGRGHEAIVRLLLTRNDLDVNLHTNLGNTPFGLAALGGHIDIIKLLLAQDDVGINLPGGDGYTPLSFAVSRGHEAIAQLLLARNDLDVNQRNDLRDTPIIIATQEGHSGIAELLLARDDVNINLRGQGGRTPLSEAIMRRHQVIVKLLLARVDLDTRWRDHAGSTYLAIAAYRKNEEVVKWLLAKGNMDINSKNAKGQGPLTLAAGQGSDAVVKLLLAQDGIDINLGDSSGYTPLDYANQPRCEGVAKLLRAAGGRTAMELRVGSGKG